SSCPRQENRRASRIAVVSSWCLRKSDFLAKSRTAQRRLQGFSDDEALLVFGLVRASAQDARVQSPAEDRAEDGGQNVDGEKAAAIRTWNRHAAPAGDGGEQARAKIAGGVE